MTKLRVYDVELLATHQLPHESLTQTLNRLIRDYSQVEEIQECNQKPINNT